MSKDGGPAFPAQHFDMADHEHGMSPATTFAAKAPPTVYSKHRRVHLREEYSA